MTEANVWVLARDHDAGRLGPNLHLVRADGITGLAVRGPAVTIAATRGGRPPKAWHGVLERFPSGLAGGRRARTTARRIRALVREAAARPETGVYVVEPDESGPPGAWRIATTPPGEGTAPFPDVAACRSLFAPGRAPATPSPDDAPGAPSVPPLPPDDTRAVPRFPQGDARVRVVRAAVRLRMDDAEKAAESLDRDAADVERAARGTSADGFAGRELRRLAAEMPDPEERLPEFRDATWSAEYTAAFGTQLAAGHERVRAEVLRRAEAWDRRRARLIARIDDAVAYGDANMRALRSSRMPDRDYYAVALAALLRDLFPAVRFVAPTEPVAAGFVTAAWLGAHCRYDSRHGVAIADVVADDGACLAATAADLVRSHSRLDRFDRHLTGLTEKLARLRTLRDAAHTHLDGPMPWAARKPVAAELSTIVATIDAELTRRRDITHRLRDHPSGTHDAAFGTRHDAERAGYRAGCNLAAAPLRARIRDLTR